TLIDKVRQHFGLRLSPPLPAGTCSWVAPATLPDSTAVIVKISWPHREMYGEAAALRLWDGRGAVRLFATTRTGTSPLLERCLPGRELARTDGDPTDRLHTGCTVLRQLWQAPTPVSNEIEPLVTVAAEWADLVEQRMTTL